MRVRRLRNRLAVEVVIEEADDVVTIEIVNVGPETPFIVVVAVEEGTVSATHVEVAPFV